jgi:hypothetical protein
MARKPPFHECALCQVPAKLRHSHIIPEFLFQPLYDPLHRYHVMSTHAGPLRKMEQKGAREYLLCHDCEQRFSKWEAYAKGAIFGKRLTLKESTPLGQRMQGLEYAPYRLFLLSLLWRMGVSEKISMFAGIELHEHEPKLRQMLLSEDPGEPHEYACVLTVLTFDGRHHADWILQPDMYEDGGIKWCRAIINGVLYVFRLSAEPWNIPEEHHISRAGEVLLAIKDVRDVPFVADILQRQQLRMPPA